MTKPYCRQIKIKVGERMRVWLATNRPATWANEEGQGELLPNRGRFPSESGSLIYLLGSQANQNYLKQIVAHGAARLYPLRAFGKLK